jgi:hypothetical protein
MKFEDNLVNALLIIVIAVFVLLIYNYFTPLQVSDGVQESIVECRTNADCPTVYCIKAPCSYNICSGGICTLVTPSENETVPTKPLLEREKDGCKIGGCSSQICADASKGEIVSTCEWSEAYICYRMFGVCERQIDGKCGWTKTENLTSCLERAKFFVGGSDFPK